MNSEYSDLMKKINETGDYNEEIQGALKTLWKNSSLHRAGNRKWLQEKKFAIRSEY